MVVIQSGNKQLSSAQLFGRVKMKCCDDKCVRKFTFFANEGVVSCNNCSTACHCPNMQRSENWQFEQTSQRWQDHIWQLVTA